MITYKYSSIPQDMAALRTPKKTQPSPYLSRSCCCRPLKLMASGAGRGCWQLSRNDVAAAQRAPASGTRTFRGTTGVHVELCCRGEHTTLWHLSTGVPLFEFSLCRQLGQQSFLCDSPYSVWMICCLLVSHTRPSSRVGLLAGKKYFLPFCQFKPVFTGKKWQKVAKTQ